MADVFVSYVSEDRAIAEKISRGLQGAGFSVWWDRHIHGGVGFRKEIDRQLGAAKVAPGRTANLWSRAACPYSSSSTARNSIRATSRRATE